MDAAIAILGSILLVSAVSFAGVLTLALSEPLLKKLLLYLVSFSAGALFGNAFIHLLPETVKSYGFGAEVSLYILAGIVVFFVVEKFIKWHHCHTTGQCEHIESFRQMNLLGDAAHNLLDGLVIAGAYIASIPLGITTTLAVVLHEIPQEMGDFGVLLHGGYTKGKALMLNLAATLTAFAGAAIGIFFSSMFSALPHFLLPFTAGGFIYIAGSDLIPEMHRELAMPAALWQVVAFALGIAVMMLVV